MIYFKQPEEPSMKDMLTDTLPAIAKGMIGVCGVKEGDSLDGIVMPLSGPPDDSVQKGDCFPFGETGKAEVIDVGTKIYDGHVFYQIRIYDP